jgi:MarR family transcriptional regulator, lower aerobic nicotinate degradation pathway regulator
MLAGSARCSTRHPEEDRVNAGAPGPDARTDFRPPIPGLLIRRSQQAHTAMWALCVQEDLTTPQFAILRVLSEGGRVDQTSLGHLAALDRSNTAEVLARLERRDLVESRRDAADKRRNLWSLTAAGTELYRRAQPAATVATELLLAPLSREERTEFVRLLDTIVVAAERRIEDMQNRNLDVI